MTLPTELAQSILTGNRLATARAITIIENEQEGYFQLLDAIHSGIGRAYRIGITGPPGAGKSTFTNYLTKLIRSKNMKVGIVAVDPTSPFTGGAILGDRVRMNDLTLDKGVFIRSMATRGNMGGLARQATEVADVLDAAGFDVIIYETVGVGQVELDIAGAADTIVVMIVPEGGDIIQGMKAGLMEIGEIFVLNKSDRPGAERMKKDLEYVLHLQKPRQDWYPKVFATIANKNEGISDAWEEIQAHKKYLEESGEFVKRRNVRLKLRVETIVREELHRHFWNEKHRQILQSYLIDDSNEKSPYKLAADLLAQLEIKSNGL